MFALLTSLLLSSLVVGSVQEGPCRGPILCLTSASDTLHVTADFTDAFGVAPAAPGPIFDPDSGSMHFRDARYGDLIVQVLDGCIINSHHWLFIGSLSDLAWDLSVLNVGTGETVTYSNPAGARSTITDVEALDCGPAPFEVSALAAERVRRLAEGSAGGRELVPARLERSTAVQPEGGVGMVLYGGRFTVEATGTATGMTFDAAVLQQFDRWGTMFFFSPNNVDLAVRIYERCGFFGVEGTSLTDIEYDLTVTDHSTGATWLYHSPAGSFSAFSDLEAFVNTEGCLFGSGFESGGPWDWTSAVP